ncbi:MAG TPA: protein kinase, partial [Polyangiaceae bacterium]
MSPSPTAAELRALGEYDLLAPIGRGGMAQVHAARLRAQPDRLVALKVIRPELGREQGFVAMFLDEARIASRLSHPNIVGIYGLGHDAGHHYLAMELLHGRTLLETWTAANAQKKRIPFIVAAWICARVADALHHAHELRDETGAPAQVVHRDVNPSNVFLCTSGEPKVIDFGLAKARDRISATAIGVVKGKLAYLSPEQVAGKPIDRRSDIFSLGVTLWEITVDRRLFREDSDVATVRRVMAADVPDPTTLVADYPPALAAVLHRALESDPMRRYASAEELARALDQFVADAGGCDTGRVASLLADLFPPSSVPAWEAQIFGANGAAAGASGGQPGSVRVWDEEARKMTWVAAVAETSLGGAGALAVEPVPARSRGEEIDAALAARMAGLASDRAALASVYLERSLVDELRGDRSAAIAHAERALETFDGPAAHATLRRLTHARDALESLLIHQQAELTAAVGDAARADRWAERARLLRAAGHERADVVAAYERALGAIPDHPAALKGLEAELQEAGAPAALAAHVARMARAYAGDPELAAWLHVERAELLDDAKGTTARAALEEALALDPTLGPVRTACVQLAARHRDWGWLAALLEEEAALEPAAARAAALELEAACVHRLALGRNDRALALLERTAARAPADPHVFARVADELVLLAEQAAYPSVGERVESVLAARRRRLAFVTGASARAAELRSVAALEESRGEIEAALAALRQARKEDPKDPRAGESLDRLLAAASRTGERLALQLEEAERAATPEARAERLLRASSLASGQGDRAWAIELARACLVVVPAHRAALDALARLLVSTPSPTQAEEARARIAVHAHAADHALDSERRIAQLETVALLTEELLGEAALAATTYEQILTLAPGRRSALLGLARAAHRTGNRTRYVQAVLEEAGLTKDAGAADGLRMEAAEALVEGGAPADQDRARALVADVLGRDPAHEQARRLELRIHEAAGRWGEVERALAARVELAIGAEAKAELLAARADVLRTHLRDPAAALAALREAFRLVPSNEERRRAILSLLAEQGDLRTLRDGLLDLAEAQGATEGAREALVRAAEIDAFALGDDDSAMKVLDRAVALDPDDAIVNVRRARIEARRAPRFTASPDDEAAAQALAANPRAPHALRAIEKSARRAASAPRLANVLSAQAEAWQSPPARLGALHALGDLMEWNLPPNDPVAVLDAILALAPADVAAEDARTRVAMRAIADRIGDPRAHLEPLRKRAANAAGRTERHLARLALAWVLDPE